MAGLTLVDFPDRAARPGLFSKKGFLTVDEASIMLARIERDRSDAVPDKLTVKRIIHHLRDWKLWEFAFLLMCNVSSRTTHCLRIQTANR